MKKILLLATGGTIASKPSEKGALTPAISASEILEYVPRALMPFQALIIPKRLFSEMTDS